MTEQFHVLGRAPPMTDSPAPSARTGEPCNVSSFILSQSEGHDNADAGDRRSEGRNAGWGVLLPEKRHRGKD